MKIGVQLNPRVSIDKSDASLMPTLIEQVRVADQSDREVPLSTGYARICKL